MKTVKFFGVAIMLLTFFSGTVAAATCEIQYTRTACPGKESISYKKCKGKASCSKFKEADSAEQCAAMATKSCANKRLSITKSKVINAIFDGNAITTSGGSDDFCTEYANTDTEFNQC